MGKLVELSRRGVGAGNEFAVSRVVAAYSHILVYVRAFEETAVLLLLGRPEEEVAVVDGPVEDKGLVLHVLYVEAFDSIQLIVQSLVASFQLLVTSYLLLQLDLNLLLFFFGCI